jgi:hypothetical protein
MDICEAIRTGQSSTRYRPDPVPGEVLNRAFDARQRWRASGKPVCENQERCQ